MKFDIEAYKRRTARLDDTDIDYGAFRERPLDGAALRCLRYMHDVELHTVCYLRDLLVTAAHRDPEITTFLTFWSYEEYWHGAALAKVLRAHGEVAGAPRIREMRRARRVAEALKPLAHGAGSAVFGPAMTAVHMSWGAINEWTTQAGYARVAQRAEHPVLGELLHRIMRQEGRHIDFYASQARRRLDASGAARRVTRAALDRLWNPVGSDVMPPAEVHHLVSYLFADTAGEAMAARIDRRVDQLPGLAGLNLVSRAVAGIAAGGGRRRTP
jgi:hypothetical protein